LVHGLGETTVSVAHTLGVGQPAVCSLVRRGEKLAHDLELTLE
jgi:hypothetical protein